MRATSVCHLCIETGLLLVALASCAALAYAQRPPSVRNEETFRFRFVGPRAGNRVASVAGVPGDPSTYYAGAASGGVWKTTDGGNRWDPIFDKQPVAAIGAIAVARSEEYTSELQSQSNLVCRLLLEKKKKSLITCSNQ